MTVNGVKVKYIVDTGGQTGTIRENAMEMKAMGGIGARGVSDVNGMSLSYDEAILKDVQLSPNYKLAHGHQLPISSGRFENHGRCAVLPGQHESPYRGRGL